MTADGGHRHEEIFLPLSVDSDGTVEGLLIDDMEAEKGPLIIEEIVDAEGTITDVIIERASDLSLDNLPRRKGMNRKFGAMVPNPPEPDPTSQTQTESKSDSRKGSKSESKSASRKRSLLPLIVLLVTVAFSLGFVLSVILQAEGCL